MIFVSSGHERSISLEIFLKSFISLTPKEQGLFVLAAAPQLVEQCCQTLRWECQLNSSEVQLPGGKLKLIPIMRSGNSDPHSTLSMLEAMQQCSSKDILLTMPTSKDQLILNGKPLAGHTEFFRQYFNNPDIGMLFAANNNYTLLLTDHLPLNKVTHAITSDLVIQKTSAALEQYFFRYQIPINEVVFSGVNPHAGEGGILGDEESHITKAIKELRQRYRQTIFSGPLSGDTLQLFKNDKTKRQLHVYAFHDQGLPVFKALHGLLGVNISIGLPFLRMSVDHGTAFELYGQDRAFMLGALYLLKHALRLQGIKQ